MSDIYHVLKELNIEYQKLEHEPVFTVEESDKICADLKGTNFKNLFLRNKKGNKHYLVVISSEKHADLKKLEKQLNADRLSFASPERLKKHLNLTPGSVSPFGLISDKNKEVDVIIDQDLMYSEYIQIHPNTNTASLSISTNDFKKFLDWSGNKIEYLPL